MKRSFWEISRLCNLLSSKFLLGMCTVCELMYVNSHINKHQFSSDAVGMKNIHCHKSTHNVLRHYCSSLCKVSAMLLDSFTESRPVKHLQICIEAIIWKSKELIQASPEGWVFIIRHRDRVTLISIPINNHIMCRMVILCNRVRTLLLHP